MLDTTAADGFFLGFDLVWVEGAWGGCGWEVVDGGDERIHSAMEVSSRFNRLTLISNLALHFSSRYVRYLSQRARALYEWRGCCMECGEADILKKAVSLYGPLTQRGRGPLPAMRWGLLEDSRSFEWRPLFWSCRARFRSPESQL